MKPRDALLLVLLSASWGVSFLLVKIALTAMPPLWVSTGRLTFGALVLWALVAATRSALPPREKLLPFLVVALFNNALPWTFFALGQRTVSSSIASVLNATTPLWSALIAAGLRDSSLSARGGLGVLLGFLGVGLAVSGGLAGATATPGGAALILAATLGYAASTAYAKRTLTGVPPLSLATAQLSGAWLLLAPFAAATPNSVALTPAALGALVVLGVVGSGVAYWLYFSLLSRNSPTRVLAVTYLVPIWGLFWGAVAGEPVGGSALAGVAVILAGLALLNAPARRPAAVAPVLERR